MIVYYLYQTLFYFFGFHLYIIYLDAYYNNNSNKNNNKKRCSNNKINTRNLYSFKIFKFCNKKKFFFEYTFLKN